MLPAPKDRDQSASGGGGAASVVRVFEVDLGDAGKRSVTAVHYVDDQGSLVFCWADGSEVERFDAATVEEVSIVSTAVAPVSPSGAAGG